MPEMWKNVILSSAGEPNDYYEEDCAVIVKKSGTWYDFQCPSNQGYICKKLGTISL